MADHRLVATVENIDPFSGCRAKIDRAEQVQAELLGDFWTWVREADDGTPFAVNFKTIKGGIVQVRFIAEREIPDRFGVLIGDFFHNLRSALDHVVARLKEAHGAPFDTGQFIVAKSRKHFDKRAAVLLDGIPEDSAAWALIESVQPFHAGDDASHNPLAVISEMNNADKHRVVHRVWLGVRAATGLDLVEVMRPNDVRVRENHWTEGQPFESGVLLATFVLRPGVRPHEVLRRNRTVEVPLLFGEGGGRASLEDCIAKTREVVEAASALDLPNTSAEALDRAR